MLSFFPRGVLDEILNLIESVSEGFPSYSSTFSCRLSDEQLKSKKKFSILFLVTNAFLTKNHDFVSSP